MKHTLTPFELGARDENGTQIISTVERGTTFIARVFNTQNTAFIVRACNSHDALVEQLQFMADHFSYKMSHEMQTKLDAVLKLAKGE